MIDLINLQIDVLQTRKILIQKEDTLRTAQIDNQIEQLSKNENTNI